MEDQQEEKIVYEFFLWSVLIKGAISLIELVVGTLLFIVPSTLIISWALLLLQYIPVAQLQNALMQEVATYTSGTVTFVAFYLLSRGFIKVFLIAGLLMNKLWAYPASLVVLALLVFYQCYQIVTTHSPIVILITLFDLFVMYFIWREWKIVTKEG
jgi:uncharacterized membrane protein